MMSMAEAYKRQRERESLPCHNRNLNLGPISVASFSLEVEAADYADKMERITGDFHRYEKELDGKYHVYGEE
jgi:hypothetical protein